MILIDKGNWWYIVVETVKPNDKKAKTNWHFRT